MTGSLFFSTSRAITLSLIFFICMVSSASEKPNIVLIMTDDQGWGQTGYYNHPLLKTPHLDAMAANGLRFDRFYAAAPVCSPTRASVLTGRSNDRTGVINHGFALRRQEKTLAIALKKAGYATGHFGKWHLSGIKGPGVPILKGDPFGPEVFGFDQWLTTSNFFDIDPLLGRQGKIEEFKGDSSDIIVRESLKFIKEAVDKKKPFLAVIWDGSPHNPWRASEEDMKAFSSLKPHHQRHHGELVAFDRSVGKLRQELRKMKVANNTLVWFCSDNGGLGKIQPETTGGLRGYKSSIYEGGLRVPAIIEWPDGIKPGITQYPASTMDIFPTLATILNLPQESFTKPIDGINITPLFNSHSQPRATPIPFRYLNKGALIDNNYKLVVEDIQEKKYQLYNLKSDPKESINIAKKEPKVFSRLVKKFEEWNASVKASSLGKDYPEGKVIGEGPTWDFWTKDKRYMPYLDLWKDRPEYEWFIENKR